MGLKIQGPNVEQIQQAGAQLQQILGGIPGLRSIFAERVAEGYYIDVEVNRLEAAVIEGAVQRLRPKLMTVTAVLASLIPILWETGIGSDVMKPIAAPILGGMITSTIHVLIITPLIFAIMKERALRKGTLKSSGMHV